MRIAINALSAENRSGTGRYTTELVRGLAKVDPANEYLIIVHGGSPLCADLEGLANFRFVKRGRRGRLGRIVWEQTRLTGLIAREKPDVFHAPAFVLPGRLSVPTVATIHDLVFMRYPETFGYFRRNYFQWAIPRSAYRATRIIADSEATRRDLVDLLQVRPERISVVPLGVGSEFFEPASAEAKQQLRSLLHLPTPRLKPGANPEGYVLTVGTIEPRKNLVRLVEAYEIVRRRLGRRCPALVLVGRKGWMWGEVFERIEQRGLAGDVIWSDFLSDDLVRAAYQGAALFVCLSLHEGFGLPLLEAMASGVAVIASGRSSMPEVVGEAGVLVDPGDVRAVAEAMADLLSDEDKRSGFAAKARERARTFSWQLTAQRTLAIYEEVGARNLTGFTGLTG